MAVKMKIAYEGDGKTHTIQLIANLRNCFGGFLGVNGDSDNFGTGFGKFDNLIYRSRNIGSVGIGHRLNNNGSAAADFNIAN